jgi:predicted ATP-grasp superfamily ATP-dependent carboligase
VTALYERFEHPELDSPVLIMFLEGWIDAGLGAANAASLLLDELDTTPIVSFDADTLLDHRARRPVMHLIDGMNTGLTWPLIELRAGTDSAGNDILLLVGAEPDHAWRAFSSTVVDLALDLGAKMVVGLGAYPAAVPHTRPTKLASTSVDEQLVEQIGFVRGTIDVPAGVQAAIERRCSEVGLPALGLWAQVPHYAAAMPYPAASAALIDGLNGIAGLKLDAGRLRDESEGADIRLARLVAESPEHAELIQELERHADQESEDASSGDGVGDPTQPDMELRSGDELAAELEQFLREQGD